jgi:hypothetical protein
VQKIIPKIKSMQCATQQTHCIDNPVRTNSFINRSIAFSVLRIIELGAPFDSRVCSIGSADPGQNLLSTYMIPEYLLRYVVS